MSSKIYIRSTACISPQKTFGEVDFLNDAVVYSGNRLQSIEPDYTKLIDVKLLRRMSRIIKKGVAAATVCLQQAGENNPGAITVGTAYGCLEDTGIFLTQLFERNEEALPPTAFIQSTHNTVGAQIALMLKCHSYNNTFVHRGLSFESALLDAMLLLKEGEAENVLTGGIDELTDTSYSILNRFGLYKKELNATTELYSSHSKGTIAGEGAVFFLLSGRLSADTYAELNGIHTFYKPEHTNEIQKQVFSFLADHATAINDIDLVITGRNGNIKEDMIFDELEQSVFNKLPVINYKHFCGEYPTAVSFALWMAAHIAKTGVVPRSLNCEVKGKIKTILICNQYLQTHYSLMLVSAVS